MKNNFFKNVRIMLLCCILGILAVVVTVFVGYRRGMNEARGLAPSLQDGAGMAISCVRQTAVRNGVTEWCLDAVSGEYINAEARAVFAAPSVTFFMEGRGKVVMTAATGTVQTDSNNIRVSGDVIVKDQDYVLKTQTLHYDNGEHLLSTDVPVAFSGADFDLTADSASLDMKSRQAVLKGNVRGTLSESLEL
ncbi:LPS export ABC transporter periplasmic protein LptC [Desulfococcus sp.]|uniref:LPS export ABC transporter periplasmic protein LptC n=1 Tax=Desulfococcus sp. TaxID=2025834 RepID=UPI0035934943